MAHSTGGGSAEESLWASVLLTAIEDGLNGLPNAVGSKADNVADIEFLTADKGEWAESRRRLCAVVGIDEPALVKMALAVLNGRKPAPVVSLQGSSRAGFEKQRKHYDEMQLSENLLLPVPTIQTTTGGPIEVDVTTGSLYWPISAANKGDFGIMTLPREDSKAYCALRCLTRKGGGTPAAVMRDCGPAWKDMLDHICTRFEVEAVFVTDGRDVGFDAVWRKIHLRLPLPAPSA